MKVIKFVLRLIRSKCLVKSIIEIDIAFPIVHGTNVEDGALQGYLKTIGIPFVGCDVTASAVGMDKYITKAVLKQKWDSSFRLSVLYNIGLFQYR